MGNEHSEIVQSPHILLLAEATINEGAVDIESTPAQTTTELDLSLPDDQETFMEKWKKTKLYQFINPHYQKLLQWDPLDLEEYKEEWKKRNLSIKLQQ